MHDDRRSFGVGGPAVAPFARWR